MKFMKRRNLRLFAVAAVLPFMASAAVGQRAQKNDGNAAVVQQVTGRLHDFLAAVPRGDKQVFDSFFADDVIYTRASGLTVRKQDIMHNIDVRGQNEPNATYDADDITVHPYGSMAIVNFRLIQHNQQDGKEETNYFRNTGTFLKRNGKWQVVAWQATKVPPQQ